MPTASIVLVASSLIVLVFGFYAWRLTSSRPLIINILLSSAFLLISAYAMTDKSKHDFGFMLAFFATMLCGGRAVAYLWRSRKETELWLPGLCVSAVTVAALIGTIAAYQAR